MPDIRLLTAEEARERLDDLCEVLADCVTGGASVGFMQPYGLADAQLFWESVIAGLEEGALLLLTAEDQGRVLGTVQVGLRQPPNQPHRGDLKKLLVHRSARGLGLSRQLMKRAEKEAALAGKTLLVLDTATGSPAEEISARFGWQRVGVIPDYAMWPEGGLCDTTVFYKRVSAA